MIDWIVQTFLLTAIATGGTIIFNKVRQLPEVDRYKALAHILAPAAVVVATMYSGGLVAIGFDRTVGLSALKTEIKTGAVPSPKPGFVVIADPDAGNSEYVVEVTNPSASIWTSLDEKAALDNATHVNLIASGLDFKYPLIKVNDPLAVVVEGELGANIVIDNQAQSIDEWKLAARRRLALIVPVLFNCFVALGIGLVTGVPPIDLKQHNTG
jgi:hypothetical protein